MFKSIFRSKKKSKSGLATSSIKDAGNQATTSRGVVSPVTAFQLTNEAGHSERAVDVPGEKLMNYQFPVLNSIPSGNVVSSDIKRYLTLSEAHLNTNVEPVHKVMDKENMITIQSEGSNTVSHSLQKLGRDKFDGVSCTLYQQQQQQQQQRSQVNVLTKVNKMPDVLLINDFDHNKTVSNNAQINVQCSTVESECGNKTFTKSESTNFHVDTFSKSINPSRSSCSSTASLSSTASSKSGTYSACHLESHLVNHANTQMDDNDDNASLSDDAMPELVPFNVTDVNVNSHMRELSDVSMDATCFDKHHDQAGVKVLSNTANESEMYILTDSFLDYSNSSCVNATIKPVPSRVRNSDVMVVDDYTPQTVTVCREEHQRRLDSEYDQGMSGMSLSWSHKEQPFISLASDCQSLGLERQHEISTVKQKQWQRKPVRDWSTNDVLLWVEDVGLGNFYEAFKRNAVIGRDLSVISIKLLDRLQIYGQQDREQVLNRLYLLHAPGMTCIQSVDNEGSLVSPYSMAESDLVAAMTNCSHGGQAREVETNMLYCTSVVKQLSFDEMSLGSDIIHHIERRDNSSTSSDSTATSIRHSHVSYRSVSTSTDEHIEQCHYDMKSHSSKTLVMLQKETSDSRPTEVCDIERLEKENNSDLLNNISELKEVFHEKELQTELLEKDKSHLETQINLLEAVDQVHSLHSILSTMSSGAVASVLAVNLNVTETGSLGFMLGLDSCERPIVKRVEQGVPLKKGDRICEVNGCQVINLAELQLYKYLRSLVGDVKIVVLRLPESNQSNRSEDIDSLKEDLALALMELEAVQQENKDLTNELNRFKKYADDAYDGIDSDDNSDKFNQIDD